MDPYILQYRNGNLKEIPETEWKQEILAAPEFVRKRLNFMSGDHHAVRYFVVRQLPLNQGRPLSVKQIAEGCSIPQDRVKTIIEDLEKHLFFLVRDDRESVSWAFPVTVDETPHALAFNHGERLFGA